MDMKTRNNTVPVTDTKKVVNLGDIHDQPLSAGHSRRYSAIDWRTAARKSVIEDTAGTYS